MDQEQPDHHELRVPISELAFTTAGDSSSFSVGTVVQIRLSMAQNTN
ncbi:hypothetical protein MY8738_009791 [Beauveria namnaoensis]